jgi:hypothetical protein
LSWLLFLDESGQDGRACPYEVLAGIAIEERQLWGLICRVQDAEIQFFGQRISDSALEFKGRKLLKKKVYKHAAQMPPFPPEERTALAKSCLIKGIDHFTPTRQELTALAQAKLAFVEHLLMLCSEHQAKALGSIVAGAAPRTDSDFLRKDYSYLFERYHSFLDAQPGDTRGLVVFDELEKSQCHILIEQMSRYFRQTRRGRMRAGKIIPEPFFVHSHLTTAIQLADLIAYITAWGLRLNGMNLTSRAELQGFVQQIKQLQSVTQTLGQDGQTYSLFGFKYIDDLRPFEDRLEAIP